MPSAQKSLALYAETLSKMLKLRQATSVLSVEDGRDRKRRARHRSTSGSDRKKRARKPSRAIPLRRTNSEPIRRLKPCLKVNARSPRKNVHWARTLTGVH